MSRRGRATPGTRPRKAEAHRPRPPRSRGDYDFDYAGTVGEADQNEYGGDLYGGGRYGRGPFEQSQRYGARGFDSGTGAYGSLQRQYEGRYASGGYAGLKTSGRALGGPPGAGSAPARSRRLPRTGGSNAAGRVGEARSSADGGRAPRGAATPRSRAATPRRARSDAGKGATGRGTSSAQRAATAPRPQSVSASRARTARRSLKGDQRSDQRIRQDICERLSQPVEPLDVSDLGNEHLDVSDVTVRVDGGLVTLEGTVPERRMKHYIEDLVDACPGVQDIENRIRVRR